MRVGGGDDAVHGVGKDLVLVAGGEERRCRRGGSAEGVCVKEGMGCEGRWGRERREGW